MPSSALARARLPSSHSREQAAHWPLLSQDAGLTRLATLSAIALVGATSLTSDWAVAAGWIIVLAVLALLLDGGVQTNQVISQRVVYSLNDTARGRLNAAYMGGVFVCGALGSSCGAALYSIAGCGGALRSQERSCASPPSRSLPPRMVGMPPHEPCSILSVPDMI